MHPKNSTTPTAVQYPLLTVISPFNDFDCIDKSEKLMEVRPGMLASEALSSSSNLLSAVTSILDQFLVNGLSSSEIYGVRFMVEAALALIDASAQSVEFGNSQGGEA